MRCYIEPLLAAVPFVRADACVRARARQCRRVRGPVGSSGALWLAGSLALCGGRTGMNKRFRVSSIELLLLFEASSWLYVMAGVAMAVVATAATARRA